MMCKIKRKRSNPCGLKVHFLICFLSFFLLMSTGTAYSQDGKITIKGIVTDSNGEPLIGATVGEKGTTNATMTGIDGDYALTAFSNGTLTISYVGFIPQEISINGKTQIDILLKEDSQMLDEVVVTALGIKRDKKSLGYALQEVKGEDLLKNRDANVANSLTGKVAGLQIKQASSGIGGSSRIVLRGNSSITGSNQPLVVVDGVPIDSSTGADNDDRWGESLSDTGGGMADISPDDIESISVLKGPAAAALYGSRAGNGVIMITTKTGKGGNQGIGISYTTNLTFENPMMKPKYQNRYGQGSAGEYNNTSASSWGGEMNGQTYNNYIGKEITYNPGYMDISDFLNTGTSWTNSIDITSSGEKSSVRLGVMNLQNKGVVPNSDLNKTSVTLRGTAELTSKLTLDAKGTFLQQQVNNRVRLGGNLDNIFYQFLRTPRSVSLSDFTWGQNGYRSEYKNQLNPYAYPVGTTDQTGAVDSNLAGRPISYTSVNPGSTNNPYWSVYNNTNNDRRTRFIGLASLKYDFTDWLSIQGRYGIDYTSSQAKEIHGSGSVFSTYKDVNGNIMMSKGDNYEMNADLLITFNKQLTEKLGLVATVGGNRMYARSESLWSTANGLDIEYFYDLSNAVDPRTRNTLYRKKINSVYGTASFAWDNTYYLDVTARNDWSSALNNKNRSYFYPSFSGSWLFTETFKGIKNLNYGKVRLSWAQVGNDVDPYKLHDYVTMNNGSPLESSIKANYNLKSETVNSYEIGLEMKGFNNRMGLDFAYYNKETKDLITTIDKPASSGYTKEWVNAGDIRNSGVELLLYGSPVKTKDFEWEVSLNWSKNNNKILKLHGENKRQVLSHSSYSGEIIIVADEGGAYGDMYGKPYERDDNGNIIVNDQGLPTVSSDFVKLGNSSPKWMGGITNTFRFKGFDLSFLIDMRYGGKVYMGSYRAGASMGTLDFTEAGRDGMVVPGVKTDGTVNDIQTRGDLYWGWISDGTTGSSEPWIYDATNIRLRELTIGYTFPRKLLAKTPIKGARISFVGRNLWMIHSKTDGFDPEAGYTTGNAQGYELGSMPTLRSLGFNVNVTF